MTYVVGLAGIGVDHRLDAIGPRPAWLEREATYGVVAYSDDFDHGFVRTAGFIGGIVRLYLKLCDEVDGHGLLTRGVGA